LRLSLSNGIFSRRSLDKNIAEVKRLGFENLEFNMRSVETEDDMSIYEAKKLVDASGLKCLTLHVGSLNVKDPVEVNRAVYYGKISLDFAHELHAPVMVIHSSIARRLSESQRRTTLGAFFNELTLYSKKLNVKLALENLSYASSGYNKSVDKLKEIFGVIDPADIMGFTLDFCHSEAAGQTFGPLERYYERLCNIHMSNRAHRPFETETPGLTVLMKKLSEYGYAGPLTIELGRKCTTEEILKTKSVIERIMDF